MRMRVVVPRNIAMKIKGLLFALSIVLALTVPDIAPHRPGLCPSLFACQRADDDVETMVAGALARSEAVFSGRMEYEMTTGFSNTNTTIGRYTTKLSFSGESWAVRWVSGSASVSHRGKFVEYVIH